MGARWDGPPPEEAYGRVTDPNRFAGLHAVGRDLLDELERHFTVSRETFSEPDRHGDERAPAVRLVPDDPAASPLTIVFDAFPGLIVCTGRDDSMHPCRSAGATPATRLSRSAPSGCETRPSR